MWVRFNLTVVVYLGDRVQWRYRPRIHECRVVPLALGLSTTQIFACWLKIAFTVVSCIGAVEALGSASEAAGGQVAVVQFLCGSAVRVAAWYHVLNLPIPSPEVDLAVAAEAVLKGDERLYQLPIGSACRMVTESLPACLPVRTRFEVRGKARYGTAQLPDRFHYRLANRFSTLRLRISTSAKSSAGSRGERFSSSALSRSLTG